MSIETTVIGFLSARLTESVSAEVPKGPPSSFVVVERTGGGDAEDGHLRRATLAVQSCAPTLFAAIGLSERVRTHMRLLPTLPGVFRCECTREYNYTDTRSKIRRYQAIFEIIYMEEAATT